MISCNSRPWRKLHAHFAYWLLLARLTSYAADRINDSRESCDILNFMDRMEKDPLQELSGRYEM